MAAHFTVKLQAAFQSQKYDSFVDFGTVCYAATSAFQMDTVPHILLSWQDETDQKRSSPPVQVALHTDSGSMAGELARGVLPEQGEKANPPPPMQFGRDRPR